MASLALGVGDAVGVGECVGVGDGVGHVPDGAENEKLSENSEVLPMLSVAVVVTLAAAARPRPQIGTLKSPDPLAVASARKVWPSP